LKGKIVHEISEIIFDWKYFICGFLEECFIRKKEGW
jgi:hypothetical protein